MSNFLCYVTLSKLHFSSVFAILLCAFVTYFITYCVTVLDAFYIIWRGKKIKSVLRLPGPHGVAPVNKKADCKYHVKMYKDSRWSAQSHTALVHKQRRRGEDHVSRSTCRRLGCRSTGSRVGTSPGCCCCRYRSWPVHCESPALRSPRGYASPAMAAVASACNRQLTN